MARCGKLTLVALSILAFVLALIAVGVWISGGAGRTSFHKGVAVVSIGFCLGVVAVTVWLATTTEKDKNGSKKPASFGASNLAPVFINGPKRPAPSAGAGGGRLITRDELGMRAKGPPSLYVPPSAGVPPMNNTYEPARIVPSAGVPHFATPVSPQPFNGTDVMPPALRARPTDYAKSYPIPDTSGMPHAVHGLNTHAMPADMGASINEYIDAHNAAPPIFDEFMARYRMQDMIGPWESARDRSMRLIPSAGQLPPSSATSEGFYNV